MIAKDALLPEVIRQYPGTREVFDKYGLHGCGGQFGPKETVEFFAQVHRVPLEPLLQELEEATTRAGNSAFVEDTLYQRFFRAAIFVVLTAGASMGALILFLIGIRQNFKELDLFGVVQGHANAQVYGWLGLFVMGFAYQAIPRFKYTKLWRPDLAALSFHLMISGVVLRAIATGGWVVLGVAGNVLEIAAIVLFLTILGKTIRARDSWDKYLWTALACFLITAIAEPILYVYVFTAPTPTDLVMRVADWQLPFRDVQILGFAGLMIFGVGQRILPAAFGFREPSRAVSTVAFVMLTLGLAVDAAGWIAFRATKTPAWALVSWGGTVLYALATLGLVWAFRGGSGDRSTKFIRAAFAWAALAAILMIVEPFYNQLAGMRFSHAFHGAIRHSFTVGFVTLMIVGVSLKVVPILKGVELQGLPSLWIPFLLITVGNAMRVGSQIATDFSPGAWFVMGMSGTLEVFGLALWGGHILAILAKREKAESGERPSRIDASMSPAKVLDWFPETLEVFVAHGFGELRNPILRNTIARRISLRTACGMRNVNLDGFLASLNRIILKETT